MYCGKIKLLILNPRRYWIVIPPGPRKPAKINGTLSRSGNSFFLAQAPDRLGIQGVFLPPALYGFDIQDTKCLICRRNSA